MKYFVISDIHSFYKETIKALHKVGWEEDNSDHMLILCGDAFDRGEESAKIYYWLCNLIQKKKIIWVKGNHEELLIELLLRGRPLEHDKHNCTDKTVRDLAKALLPKEQYECSFYDQCQHLHFLIDWINENTVNYYEVGRYVFVHSWYPYWIGESWRIEFTTKNPLEGSTKEDWHNAVWENPVNNLSWLKFTDDMKDKTLVIGHWHTSAFHNLFEMDRKDIWDKESNFGIFYDEWDRLVALDACTAASYKVNVFVISDVNAKPLDKVNKTKYSEQVIHLSKDELKRINKE